MKAKVLEVDEVRMTPSWMHSLGAFIGEDGNAWAIAKEKAIEENIIKLLSELDIHASVKSDRYSLPVHGSVASNSGFSSYVSDIYDSSSVKRQLLKEILNVGARKIRFYVYIHTDEDAEATGFRAMFSKRFIISVRYYILD